MIAFLLFTLVIIVQRGNFQFSQKCFVHVLKNPVFVPKMNLFYNQNTTLNNLLSFILKQFVEEVSRSHYIYRHRDSCGMLLRLQPHGKSKKLMIKAVSLKHDFHIFIDTVKCTIYYPRYFSLQTTDMSSFMIVSICFF